MITLEAPGHIIELHHHRDRCRVVCRRCGQLTDGATPESAGRLIERHRHDVYVPPRHLR